MSAKKVANGNRPTRLRLTAPAVFAAAAAVVPADSLATAERLPESRHPVALVSPDRIDDIPSLKPDVDNFPRLDDFAWRAFIAVNWPSKTEAASRGAPDRSRTLGDPGPRVWETYKSRYELFQADPDRRPIAPPPWATYEAVNPCGPGVDDREKTLASFEPFMDFNQFEYRGAAGNPLVAQNRTYTRYEARVNEPHYTALAASGWAQGQNLPDARHPARLPPGSVAVKGAWRILTEADTEAVRARFYVVERANVVDVARTKDARKVVCSKADVALVGLHIVIRTPSRPQGIWATFEHIDNVPAARDGEPDAGDAGMPYSYFDASTPERGLWPPYGSPETLPVSLNNPPRAHPEPMQVVRQYPIHRSTLEMNARYWATPGIRGTVWENYMLVATQWPTRAHPIAPYNDGVFFPEVRKENLVNTTMETYFQDPPSSCMGCHKDFNELGRDFIGMLGSFR